MVSIGLKKVSQELQSQGSRGFFLSSESEHQVLKELRRLVLKAWDRLFGGEMITEK
jgi:hypothetical protein